MSVVMSWLCQNIRPLSSNFEAHDITTEIVPTLSDAQLIQLGLKTLEKRQLLRSLCRNSSTRNGKLSLFSLRLSQ